MNKNNINIIEIYQSKSGEIKFQGDYSKETIWGNINQIAQLFNVQKPAISKHLKNIFRSGELNKNTTVSILETVQNEGGRKIKREIEYYNLDAILSVGYRVNSINATLFRKWATSVLKKYTIQGYAINKNKLEQAEQNFEDLQNTIKFLQSKITSENLKGREKDIFNLLSDYSKTLSVLEEFDKNNIGDVAGTDSSFILDYESAIGILKSVKQDLILRKQASDLFATERGKDFQSIIGSLYQTFDGRELYSSIEKKAAHLLYFTIKDHPFSDGNKRSGAFLFVYFLNKNNYLYKKSGEKKINDNALAALALLVAESNPKEKDLMIKLIMNLISEKK